MFAISDVAPGTQQPSATQLQMQLAASIAHAPRVAAAKSGDGSPDAGNRGSGGRQDNPKAMREAAQRTAQHRASVPNSDSIPSSEAATRSVIEAQEESETQTTLTAAFQARYAITDLLSVIRDPQDELLPNAPSEDAA